MIWALFKEANFGNSIAKILRKSMREEREMMWWSERKTIEFWWSNYRNSCSKCSLERRVKKIGIVAMNCQNCKGEERDKKKN